MAIRSACSAFRSAIARWSSVRPDAKPAATAKRVTLAEPSHGATHVPPVASLSSVPSIAQRWAVGCVSNRPVRTTFYRKLSAAPTPAAAQPTGSEAAGSATALSAGSSGAALASPAPKMPAPRSPAAAVRKLKPTASALAAGSDKGAAAKSKANPARLHTQASKLSHKV